MRIDSKDIGTFFSLFMVIVIDAMGIVLVMPVLTTLLLNPDSPLVALDYSRFARGLLYGLGMGIFALFMFFGAPLLGDLSDKYGRKKMLLLCLLGTGIGYLVSAAGVYHSSLCWLLIGRAICGLMAGSQPIAQAAIADMSTLETKALNLSMIVLASTIGVTIGPLIGGYTSDSTIISWFNLTTPFEVAAIVSVINAILLVVFFKETFQPKRLLQFDLLKGLHLFFAAFKDQAIITMSGFFLCQLLAWALYFQAISWLLLEEYHYNTLKLGWFTAYIGIAFSIALTVVVRWMLDWLRTEVKVFKVCIVIVAVANFAAAIFSSEWMQWFWATFNAAAAALCYSMALTIFSNAVSDKQQGWIMGITGSLAAASWTFTGAAAGLAGYINIRLPYWVCGGLCIISFLLVLFYQKHHCHRVDS